MFGATQGFGGFGAAAPTNPFGGATASPAFGQQQQAFGATTPGAFGAPAAAPAFGAAAAPAFGAAPASPFGGAFGAPKPAGAAFGAFGATAPAFGATQPAFGAAAAPAFGQALQPAFGMGAAPAFGATAAAPAFGAAPAAFGAAAPAFGAAPAGGGMFGAPATGGGMFGAAPAGGLGAFGAPATGGLFGAPGAFGGGAPAAGNGTRAVAYAKTVEKDGTGAAATQGNFVNITAMPQYSNKSVEELRWEDYAAGVKSAAAGPAPGAQANPFGAPAAAAPNPFGAPAATPAFGASAPAAFGAAPGGFGASAAAQPFGLGAPGAFGAPAANPFGSPGGGAFGAATPAFGSPAPAFGALPAGFGAPNPFGTTAAPAFGAASTGAFGQPAATGAMFGATPAPAFGATPSMFGTPASAAAPAFGAASTPAFGAGSAGAFGGGMFGATQAAPSPFGATTTPAAGAFGGAFGGLGGFGAKPAAAAPFGTATAGAFGGGGMFSGGAFGSTAAAPSMFGAAPAPSLFPGAAPGAMSLFGGAQAPGGFGTPGIGGLGATPAYGGFMGGLGGVPQQQQAAAPPPTVSSAPYGAMPSLPTVPEPKVGIATRPARSFAPPSPGLRASPLVSLRATASGVGGKLGVMQPSRPSSASPLGSLGVGQYSTESIGTGNGTPTNGSLLPLRAHPHRLFIREAPPSTSAQSTSSVAPAMGAVNSFTAVPAAGPAADLEERDQGPAPPATKKGPQPVGNGVSSTLSSLLPQLGRLAEEGYSYQPSPVQLAAMAASDPDSLAKVSSFVVSREGMGSIRWLQPVDVRKLQLQDIVTIQKGEIFCYAEGPKPPQGRGLNTDAEITLLGIHKMDKETGERVREGPALVRWEKALRTMCAKMGAKFVAYKPELGLWRFEVEHFSRYGLLLDEDDAEEESEQEPALWANGSMSTPAGGPGQDDMASPPAQAAARRGMAMEMEGEEEGTAEVSLMPDALHAGA